MDVPLPIDHVSISPHQGTMYMQINDKALRYEPYSLSTSLGEHALRNPHDFTYFGPSTS